MSTTTADKVRVILHHPTDAVLYKTGGDFARNQLGMEPPSIRTLQDGVYPQPFVDETGPHICVNEQVQLLRVLYASLPAPEQASFIEPLLRNLTYANGRVVAQILVDLRRVDTLPTLLARQDLQFVLKNLAPNPRSALEGLWNGLRLKLAMEPGSFSHTDLDTLAVATDALDKLLPRRPGTRGMVVYGGTAKHLQAELSATKGTIAKVVYLRLKSDLLAQTNPEINSDQIQVVARIRRLGLSGDLVAALEAIERKLSTAATPPQFKDAMDSIRTLLEGIVVHGAKHVAAAAALPLVANKPFGPYLAFLGQQGAVSPEEEQFFAAAYKMISNAGTHTLRTAPETAKVAKNIAIELAFLLLGRLGPPAP